jgi:hypothetical protein
MSGSGTRTARFDSDADDAASSSAAGDVARLRARTELGLTPLLDPSQRHSAVRAALEAGKERETLDGVLQYAGEREREIREVCDVHYAEFVRSVDELLDVREDTMALHDAVAELNADLQLSGEALGDVAQRLVTAKRTLRNVRRLRVLVDACRLAAELAERADAHADQRRFFEALRGVAALERALDDAPHSPLLALEFGRYLRSVLPLMRTRIRDKAMQALNEWLELARRRALEVGKLALDRTARRAERERQRPATDIDAATVAAVADKQRRRDSRANSSSNTSSSSNNNNNNSGGLSAAAVAASGERPLMDELGLNFRPLYQCAAVYAALGISSQFATYFTENRRKQADLIEPADADNFFDKYGPYFLAMAGFFIIEATAVASISAVIVPTHLSALWAAAMAKLKVVLQEQLKLCRSANTLRDMKAFVVYFNDTLRVYGFDVAPLVAAQHDMRSYFVELSQRDAIDEFNNIIVEHGGTPVTLRTDGEYNRLGARHGLVPHVRPALPYSAEYSALVPNALDTLLDCVGDVRVFSADLPGVATLLWRTADQLIADLARRIMAHAKDTPSMQSVAARAQMSCDVRHIVEVLPVVEARVARLASAVGMHEAIDAADDDAYAALLAGGSSTESDLVVSDDGPLSAHDANLNSAPTLRRGKAARALVEAQTTIVALVRDLTLQSVLEFLEGATQVNWAPPGNASSDPRGYIVDVVMFLEGSMVSMAPLTAAVRSQLLSAVFQRVASYLAALLANDAVRRINLVGVMNLDTDLRHVEQFEQRCGVAQGHFEEPRQLVRLLTSQTMLDFCDPTLQRNRYRLIAADKQRLLAILEKWELKMQSLFVVSAKDKDSKQRREQIATLISSLKGGK